MRKVPHALGEWRGGRFVADGKGLKYNVAMVVGSGRSSSSSSSSSSSGSRSGSSSSSRRRRSSSSSSSSSSSTDSRVSKAYKLTCFSCSYSGKRNDYDMLEPWWWVSGVLSQEPWRKLKRNLGFCLSGWPRPGKSPRSS